VQLYIYIYIIEHNGDVSTEKKEVCITKVVIFLLR